MMKRLLRQGWIRAGVPLSVIESIADHSFNTAIIAYIIASLERQYDPSIDPNRVVAFSLFHDFLESLYFDVDKSITRILPEHEAIALKVRLDEKSLHHLMETIKNEDMKNIISRVLTDNTNEKERLILKIADKLELGLQAKDYYLRGMMSIIETKKFFESVNSIRNEINTFHIKELLEVWLKEILT